MWDARNNDIMFFFFFSYNTLSFFFNIQLDRKKTIIFLCGVRLHFMFNVAIKLIFLGEREREEWQLQNFLCLTSEAIRTSFFHF